MNWQAFAVPAALIVALLCGCAHEPTRQPRAPGAQPALRLMTYNVNFGIPGDEPTLAAIERGDADVVFLQEINAAWERELRARFAGTYPHLAFYPRGGAGGLAILSRWPLGERQLVPPAGDGHRMRNGLPQYAPDRPTWHWTTSVGTFERQLDHIVYDVRLEPLSVEVLNAGNSDHLPVVGVFVLASSPVASAQATAMKKMSNGTR